MRKIYEYFIRNYDFIFDRWEKWELIEKATQRKKSLISPVLGKLADENVIVDIYRRVNKFSGKVKYKYVER